MLEKTGILKLEGCIKNKINRIFLTQLLYQQKKLRSTLNHTYLGLILNMSLFLLAQHSKEIA
jgi:hypothetical protein